MNEEILMYQEDLFLNIVNDLATYNKSYILDCEKADFLSVLERLYPEVADKHYDMIKKLKNDWD